MDGMDRPGWLPGLPWTGWIAPAPPGLSWRKAVHTELCGILGLLRGGIAIPAILEPLEALEL